MILCGVKLMNSNASRAYIVGGQKRILRQSINFGSLLKWLLIFFHVERALHGEVTPLSIFHLQDLFFFFFIQSEA